MAVRLPQQPGGRTPAPGALAVVQAFVNSVDIESGDPDNFGTVTAMRAWLRSIGLPSSGLREPDRLLAIRLREAIRTQLENPPADAGLGSVVGAVISELDLSVTVREGRPVFAGSTPSARALAPVVDAIRTGMDDGTWLRMRVCDRHTCRWLFYDHSKNGSSRWCATSICGSREKARRRASRRRAEAGQRRPLAKAGASATMPSTRTIGTAKP